jgi:hypothetical protein
MFLSLFFSFSFQTVPVSVHAADQYTLLQPLPCINGGGLNCGTNGTTQDKVQLSEYLQYMFNLLIALSAVVAVVRIVWGGFKYMTTDSWSGKKDGKKQVIDALVGLLMVLCTYLVLHTINPKLTDIPNTIVKSLGDTSSSGSNTTTTSSNN